MNELFSEELEVYIETEKLGRTEGSEGVKNLCKIVETIGYKDSQYFGQHEKGSYGSLINFLEDNSGAIEVILDFIKDNGSNIDEWSESLPGIPKEFVLDDEGLFLCGDPDIQLAYLDKHNSLIWFELGSIREEYLEVTEETIQEAKEWYEEQLDEPE